jgi:hypothetical protein
MFRCVYGLAWCWMQSCVVHVHPLMWLSMLVCSPKMGKTFDTYTKAYDVNKWVRLFPWSYTLLHHATLRTFLGYRVNTFPLCHPSTPKGLYQPHSLLYRRHSSCPSTMWQDIQSTLLYRRRITAYNTTCARCFAVLICITLLPLRIRDKHMELRLILTLILIFEFIEVLMPHLGFCRMGLKGIPLRRRVCYSRLIIQLIVLPIDIRCDC